MCRGHAIDALEVQEDGGWMPIPIKGVRERPPKPPFAMRHLER